jgi:hypothetical protein
VSGQTTLRFNKQLLFRNCAQIGRFPRRKNRLWRADCARTKNTVCPGVLWFNVFGFKRTPSVESSFNPAPVYIVLNAQMTLQLVSIPITNMRVQATGAESALITLRTVVRVVNLKVSDDLFTCRKPGRKVVTGSLNLVMPKLTMVDAKPCSLISINALLPRGSVTSCLHGLGAWYRTWV